MNFPKIDWLQKDEDSIVTEEELDRPYAFYKRIYTRREFEELREKAEAPFRRRDEQEVHEPVEIPDVSPGVIIKGMSDEERFFDSFDYIFANREIIYADKSLASSMPLEFGYRARWIGGRILALADILHLWEQGKWKWTCPECGEKGFLFHSNEYSGRLYCTKCKKIVWIELEDEDGRRDMEHHDEADELIQNLPYKRRNIGPHGWTRSFSRALDRMHKKTPFRSNLHSYKEVFGQIEKRENISQEERTARAQFEVAKEHGEKIAKWLESLSGNRWAERGKRKNKRPIKVQQLSPVQKLLERIKELTGDEKQKVNNDPRTTADE